MMGRKAVLVLLFLFALALFGAAVAAYSYYLMQWVETRDIYYANYRDTAYLLVTLGVACVISLSILFIRFPPEKPSQTILVVKKCVYCGATLFEDMPFCPYCGKSQSETRKKRKA